MPTDSHKPPPIEWTRTGEADAGGLTPGIRTVRSITTADIDVAYQPIMDMRTRRTFAHEALVRCKIECFANPTVLFAEAVEDGFVGRLGRAIREVTIARGGDRPLFVNIHPSELSSRWLVRPDEPMNKHLGPLYLEVTEAAAFLHLDLCRQVLREIGDRTEASLVVDDYGAGHSTLERVLQLRPKIVKLDMAIVQGIAHNDASQVDVRELLRLCAGIDAEVVAEGIEQFDDLTVLRELGVQYAQGFLLGRPSYPIVPGRWPMG